MNPCSGHRAASRLELSPGGLLRLGETDRFASNVSGELTVFWHGQEAG